MSDDKNKNTFGKQITATATGIALTALTMTGEGCKPKDVDPNPQTTDTTGTTPPTTVDSTAIKDSIALAEKKKQLAKDSTDARNRVSFGGNWGEFYGGPAGWQDEYKNEFNNYVAGLRGKFKTIAVEPAFISHDMLPEAIARVNFTGVDPNNDSHRPLVDRLNAIEASGKDAYLKKDGQKVTRQNLQLLNFANPDVAAAVKGYVTGLASQYGGVFILGGSNFESAIFEGGLDRSQITGFRNALKDVSTSLQGKKVVIGDLQSVAPEDVGKPGAVNNLATFVAKNCSKDLHFYDNNGDLPNDKWKSYFMQQNGATVYFTSLNKPVTEQNAASLKTNIGVATNPNNYPAAPNIADPYFTNTNGATAPKIAGVNVYVSGETSLLDRATPSANIALAGKALRVGAEEQLPQLPASTLALPGTPEGVVVGIFSVNHPQIQTAPALCHGGRVFF